MLIAGARSWTPFVATALLLVFAFAAAAQDDAQVAFFEERVRPHIVTACGECHGPEGTPKAGLRLTSRESVLRGGERGPAAVSGDPDASLLIEALSYEDPHMQMPPDGRLPADVRADFERWVRDGLVWPDGEDIPVEVSNFDLHARRAEHWCWQPVAPATAPTSDEARWNGSTIDRFIRARLHDGDLEPAAPASDRAWLRRVTLDLHGLPPSPDEQRAFLANPSPSARRDVVDTLLASPRFGERWASHWLDLVRYAETLGHEFDFTIIDAWRYRDYVIRALNDDVPYDTFVREHIAGDLASTPRTRPDTGENESALAPAFYWFGEQSHSPVNVRAHMADVVANQIDVASKAFQGITVACARCHDHMFDAISQADYYAMSGMMTSTRRVERVIDDDAAHAEAARDLHDALVEWRRELAQGAGTTNDATTHATSQSPVARNGDEVVPLPEAGALRGWTWFGHEPSRPFARAGDLSVTGSALWLHTQPAIDTALAGVRGQAAVRSPDFEIRAPFLHVLTAGHQSRLNLVLDGFKIIRSPIYGSLTHVLGHAEPAWTTIDLSDWHDVEHPHRAYLEVLDIAVPDPATPHSLPHDGASWARVFAVVRSTHATPPDLAPLATPNVEAMSVDNAWSVFARGEHDDVAARRLVLAGFGRNGAPAEDAPPREVPPAEAAWRAVVDELPAPTWALSADDGSGADHPLYVRGSSGSPGAPVPRRYLEAFESQGHTGAGSGRVALAEAIASPTNPLTARVAVNRVWHHLFGRGLVATVDNFGVLGQTPSHPALLDTLAHEFVDSGWSLKALIRRVVLSQSYAMSTSASTSSAARAREVDADNVLLHRQNVRRLDAEALRDTLLSVAGSLDDTQGGPPVPIHLTAHMTGRGRPGTPGPLDGANRRAIYQGVRRNFLSPMLSAFDRPAPFSCVGRRNVTNVPAQSLFLLNDPFVALMAERTADQLVAAADSTSERINALFERALARPPSEHEARTLGEYLATLRSAGDDERAAWTAVAHAVINLKAFLFVGLDTER